MLSPCLICVSLVTCNVVGIPFTHVANPVLFQNIILKLTNVFLITCVQRDCEEMHDHSGHLTKSSNLKSCTVGRDGSLPPAVMKSLLLVL